MVAQSSIAGQRRYYRDLDPSPARSIARRAGLTGPVNVGRGERIVSGLLGGALASYGLRRGGISGWLVALLGGGLVSRAATGHCPAYSALGMTTADARPRDYFENGVKIEESVTIDKAPTELYQFWRNFENLPRFMRNVESVQITGETTSRWSVKGPFGKRWEWEATIINEVENELIAWQTSGHADVQNAGSVRFVPSRSGRGTEVKAVIEYLPPAGAAGRFGAAIGTLLGRSPAEEVKADLRRFKQLMETGEVASTDGQTRGIGRDDDEAPTGHRGHRALRTHDRSRAAGLTDKAGAADVVAQSSDQSFPASDPPGWTGTQS
jgi:uncharacterized membrane protein